MEHNIKNNHISRLGEGCIFEGTLRCNGDVEIAGEFKGDLQADGTVIFRADLHTNVMAGSVQLLHGKLVGDINCSGKVSLSRDTALHGTVTASDLELAGSLEGNATISGSTILLQGAHMHGNLHTASMTMAQGSSMNGKIEMK